VVKCVDERTRLVFIANPANPTGTWLTGEEIRALHAALPPSVILVLDGAYAEFCSDPRFEDGLDLARTAENVIVTRTFSKIHGLAALRVGWGYAPSHIIEPIERIRPPFNTSIPGQEAAVAALFDDEFQARSLALVEQWRPWLTQQLGGLGLEVTPSAANFVLATSRRPRQDRPRGRGCSWRRRAIWSAPWPTTTCPTPSASPSAWKSRTAPSSTCSPSSWAARCRLRYPLPQDHRHRLRPDRRFGDPRGP
jgi:histidinol-phosphate/aromatic aminotransferase/cobyric acid decarboxylase-like protein